MGGHKPTVVYIYMASIRPIVNTPNYQRPLTLSKHTRLHILTKGEVTQEIEHLSHVHRMRYSTGVMVLDFFLFVLWSFFKTILISRSEHVDVVETHTDYTHFVGYFLSKLGFGWIADIWDHPDLYTETSKVFGKVQTSFLRARLKNSDRILCHTHPSVLAGYGIPERLISSFPNGVLTDLESRMPEIPETGELRLVYVGYVVPQRGIDVLLKAFSLVYNDLHDCKLLLVGPMLSEKLRITNMIEDLNVKQGVHLTGELQHQDVLRLLKSSSVGLYPFPRTKYLDNVYPVKVPEYLSFGLPVIASNLAGVRTYIVDGENGFLYEPEDYIALSKLIRRLVADENLRREMSLKALNSCRKFDWNLINSKAMEVTMNTIRTLRSDRITAKS